jgi:hypothetical protein
VTVLQRRQYGDGKTIGAKSFLMLGVADGILDYNMEIAWLLVQIFLIVGIIVGLQSIAIAYLDKRQRS